jgi:hypothetical protein
VFYARSRLLSLNIALNKINLRCHILLFRILILIYAQCPTRTLTPRSRGVAASLQRFQRPGTPYKKSTSCLTLFESIGYWCCVDSRGEITLSVRSMFRRHSPILVPPLTSSNLSFPILFRVRILCCTHHGPSLVALEYHCQSNRSLS